MKTKLLKIAATASLFGLLTGCASVTEGVNQNVTVLTPPTESASCTLKNKSGEWYVKSTPGSTMVHRAYGDLNVTCRKPGYNLAHESVKSKTKGMAFGNAVVGGVIGAGIDVADGAAYDYPSTIVVPMHKAAEKQTS